MAPVGVGVIGCGYWGPKLIRNFYELATAQMRMVAELQPERRGQLERQLPGIQTTANHDDVLADPAIEAVVIATPVRTHFTLAKQALEGGKHVLVEKPLAASMAEAAELVALSEERNLCLMVGHTFEYNPAVEELRRLVQSETLGKIHYIDTARLNLGLFQQDINVMWDLAPHDISILLYLLNMDPLTVSARGNGCVRPSIYDVVYLELCFPGNITAHVHVSWLEPCKVRRVTVVGDRKMAVYNDVAVEEKIKIYDRGVSLPATPGVPGEFQMSYRYGDIVSPRVVWQEPLRVECSHFVDCIRTARPARSDGRSGWRVVRILERAEQSLTHGGLRIGVADGYADLPAALAGGSGNGHVPQPHLAPGRPV